MMIKEQRNALVLALTDQLQKDGSWCGETHIQKILYVMQELLEVPTAIDFVLYKHGPFSFDLHDELSELHGDEHLEVVPTAYQYGPSLKLTERGSKTCTQFKDLVQKYQDEIEFVSKRFGTKLLADLEKITTAFYATKELGVSKSKEERAARLIVHNPLLNLDEAIQAIDEIDSIIAENTRKKEAVLCS